MNHVEELAELYALGSLGTEEEAELQRHVATCAACRKRVNDAERVVATLAWEQAKATMPRRAATAGATSNVWRFGLGVAAGLILPLLFLLPPMLRERNGEAQTHTALAALVQSHFSHVAFVRRASGVPAAKLLYARSGGWLYVIVLRPKSDLTVLLRSRNSVRNAGTIRASASDAQLFIASPGAVDEVLLARGAETVASARPLMAPRSTPAPAARP